MTNALLRIFSSPNWLYFVALFLLFPALLINLGMIAFIDDEGIRSLVALEMKISGNYITPTLFGEYYYNKPPLYNWILLAFFKLFGTINELTARLPTIFFLLLYAGTVYYFFKKHFTKKIAFLNAFALITCGRILFWDSMLALIDICFSWVIFTLFMIIYHQFQKKQYFKLFVGAYFLAALGFLLKGLPALVFLGTALLAHFIFQKQFKRLFSIHHFVGALVFLIIVGGYYFAYHQYNSLENVFTTLLEESSKRTFVKHGWKETILHFFTFPFEMIYHFSPWSFLLIYFFKKDALKSIAKSPFLAYNLLIFITTILIYWFSVEVYPRYLFMHVPLIFSVFIFLHFQNNPSIFKIKKVSLNKIINTLFGILLILATLAAFSPFFLEETQKISWLIPKTLTLGFALTTLTYLYQRLKKERLIILMIALLVIRIGFNWFVLPHRLEVDWNNHVRTSSIEIGKQYNPIFSYKGSLGTQPTTGFYISRESGNILWREVGELKPDAYYLINPVYYKATVNYEKVGELKIMYRRTIIDVGKLK